MTFGWDGAASAQRSPHAAGAEARGPSHLVFGSRVVRKVETTFQATLDNAFDAETVDVVVQLIKRHKHDASQREIFAIYQPLHAVVLQVILELPNKGDDRGDHRKIALHSLRRAVRHTSGGARWCVPAGTYLHEDLLLDDDATAHAFHRTSTTHKVHVVLDGVRATAVAARVRTHGQPRVPLHDSQLKAASLNPGMVLFHQGNQRNGDRSEH